MNMATNPRCVYMVGYGGKMQLSKNPHTDSEIFITQVKIANIIHTRNKVRLETIIETLDEDFLPHIFNVSVFEEWTEGILLCEREIARRGLHVNNPKERFEL